MRAKHERRRKGARGAEGRHRRRLLRAAGLGGAAVCLVSGLLVGGATVAGASSHFKAVSNFAHYVGGKGKANKKLSPVYIGVVNQQTATNAVTPTWTTGVQIAEKYLNAHTGGIDGHPVKLVLCKIPTTVGSAAKCGQEFANNPKIAAVAGGGIDVGNTALESALKPSKKPLFFGVSLSTVDEQYPYGFILYGDVTHVQAPLATFTKTYLHAKSVSITYPSNVPGEVQGVDVIKDALTYEGVKTIYSVGFTSSDANLTEPFEAAHVGSTTVLLAINSGGPACSDTYLTLKSLGLTKVKVLANVPCATPTNAKADGGQLPHDWYYASAVPMAGSSTPGLTSFVKIASTYGKGAVAENAWTLNGFGLVATIAKFDTELLKAGKKITPAAVVKKARAFKGPVAGGGPHLDCGGFTGFPATCNDLVSFFQNTAPTVMKPVVSWIGPPKGFKLSVTS